VQEDGTPCLADFGLATVRHNGATLTSVLNGTGTVRWMAQELFQHEDSESDAPLKVTQHSDIWSFGMLALELLTEQVPFAEKVLDTTVMYGLMKGDRPEQPGFDAVRRGLGNELWNHLRRCWEVTPENRPPLKSLLSLLERLAARWTPTPSVEQKSHYTVEVSAPPGSQITFLSEYCSSDGTIYPPYV
jgi:serine/threonine protein kinase